MQETDHVARIGRLLRVDRSQDARDPDGGNYTFVIEGMRVRITRGSTRRRGENLWVVNLHLYWRDAGLAGDFVDLAASARR